MNKSLETLKTLERIKEGWPDYGPDQTDYMSSNNPKEFKKILDIMKKAKSEEEFMDKAAKYAIGSHDDIEPEDVLMDFIRAWPSKTGWGRERPRGRAK